MHQGWYGHLSTAHVAWRLVVVAVLFAAPSAWQIIATPDPSKVAVQLVLAAGMPALAGVLLFGRELQRIVAGSLYLALVLGLVVWLVLAFGVRSGVCCRPERRLHKSA
jgi:hypothetical protein